MAAGSDSSSDRDGEYAAHDKSYSLFTKMMTWGTIISFGFGLFVVFVLIA